MLRRLSHTLFGSIAVMILTTVTGMISARSLGPSQKGVLTAVILWPAVFAAVGSLGVLESITYYSAKSRDAAAVVIGTGSAILLGLSMLLMGAGYLLVSSLLVVHGQEAVSLGRLSLVCIPLILFGTAFSSVVIGRGHAGYFNMIRCVQPLTLCLGAFGLLATGGTTATGFVAVTIVAYTFGCLTALGFCLIVVGTEWSTSLSTGRLMMTYGAKSHLGQIASMMNLQLDQLMMSAWLASQVLGLYAIAVSLASGVGLIAAAAAIASFPQIASESDEMQRLAFFGRVARAGAGLALVVAAVLWLVAPMVITLLFGAAYMGAVPATRLLLVAAVPLSLNTVLASGFRALNRAWIPSKAQLISLVATVSLLPLLLPRFEAIGAAGTSLIAYSISTVYLLSAARSCCGIGPRALLMPQHSDWRWLVNRFPRWRFS